MQKFAETRITGSNAQGVGNSLRVGGGLRGTVQRIRTDVTQPRNSPTRTTVTNQVQGGGVRTFNTGALNTGNGNLGGGNITGR
jgi:hypothetical protein